MKMIPNILVWFMTRNTMKSPAEQYDVMTRVIDRETATRSPVSIGKRTSNNDILRLGAMRKRGGSDQDAAAAADAAVDDHILDVLIIGAGFAGLGAGNLLLKRGVNNFQILEAKDYIGGRAHTKIENWEGTDIPLDIGPMWLHGGSKNILNKLAMKYNVKTKVSKYTRKVFKENGGGAFDDEALQNYYKDLYANGFLSFQEHRQEHTENDEPLSTSANLFLKKLETGEEEQLAKWFIQNLLALEYSGSLDTMSLWWWNADSSIGGQGADDYFSIGENGSDDFFVQGGHASLIKPLSRKLVERQTIELGASVTEIDYTNEIVRVSYKNSDDRETAIKARKVIVTVPLGVLKADSIKFVPKLPRRTKKSISRLGMGKVNKIFMFWPRDKVFWPASTEILGDITDRDSHFLFYNPQPHNKNQPMLFAFFQGPEVEELEKTYSKSNPEIYEMRIRDLAMESLRNCFGSDIAMPERVVVSRWNSDEYTMGAYSFNRVGMNQWDRVQLAQPIGRDQIFIAGEATHETFWATTTGAFLAGRDAARKVLRSLTGAE